jgi:Cd2+/Zn2+-exporting ATPase
MSKCGSNGCAAPSMTLSEPKTADAPLTRALYRIENMDCPTEEALIRDKLSKLPGITGLEFNLIQRTLAVSHKLPSLAPVEQALSAIGMRALRADEAPAYQAVSYNRWVVKGWIALRNRNLNINALMSIAVTGAMLIGQWPEAAMVMVLFALAEVDRSQVARSRPQRHSGLMALTPDKATVQQADGSWLETDAKPSRSAACSRETGRAHCRSMARSSGNSTVDQAPITGESLPVDKAKAIRCLPAPSISPARFEYRVTAAADAIRPWPASFMRWKPRKARAPDAALCRSVRTHLHAGRVSVAAAVAVVPPLALRRAVARLDLQGAGAAGDRLPLRAGDLHPGDHRQRAGAAARHGILIKGGVYLEEGRKLKWLALDKTGTITHGKPAQTDFAVWGNGRPALTPGLPRAWPPARIIRCPKQSRPPQARTVGAARR